MKRFELDSPLAKAGSHFDQTTFEQVHGGVLEFLPSPPARVLDVGAGTGRDARALASRGYLVTAVEPSAKYLEEAQSRPGPAIEWISDRLPDLVELRSREFDFIFVSAVWMYVPEAKRIAAMERLASLLAEGAVLVISARPELPSDNPETFWPVTESELVGLGRESGMRVIRTLEEPDSLARPLCWTTVAFLAPTNSQSQSKKDS